MDIPLVVGIGGGSGSGKSWLSRCISAHFPEHSVRIELDWFYHDLSHLPEAKARETNFDHPDAIDWKHCLRCLDSLLANESTVAPQYAFSSFSRLPEGHPLKPAPLIVIEGLHILYWEAFRERIDIGIFVETNADVRLIRRIRRDALERGYDLETTLDFWESRERPMYDTFVAPSRQFANRVWKSLEDSAFVPQLLADLQGKLAVKWKRPHPKQTRKS